MLNRRSLRIKAMQRLFAFHQSRNSELEAAVTVIKAPSVEAAEEGDFNGQDFEDEQLQVVKLFKKSADQSDFQPDLEYSDAVNKRAKDAWEIYRKKISLDRLQQRKRMLTQVDEVPQNFRWILQLFVTLYLYAIERKNKQGPEGKITDRPLLNLLHTHKELQTQDHSWNMHRDQVRQWYKELRDDPGYNENEKLTFEQDEKALRTLAKALFKSESFNQFFEQHDIFWQEDKAVIKSLVNKTLKSAQPSSVGLAPLSYNWEEDKQFFKDIFDATLDNEQETEKWIAEKAKNWDMDRIALLDRILLKMALSEMINFPSIPIKVTINEYIELSKIYSTPKSKKFVNGLLDVLAADLQEQGRIKKSGRGLIDNK